MSNYALIMGDGRNECLAGDGVESRGRNQKKTMKSGGLMPKKVRQARGDHLQGMIGHDHDISPGLSLHSSLHIETL
jgi:hypothetical protein